MKAEWPLSTGGSNHPSGSQRPRVEKGHLRTNRPGPSQSNELPKQRGIQGEAGSDQHILPGSALSSFGPPLPYKLCEGSLLCLWSRTPTPWHLIPKPIIDQMPEKQPLNERTSLKKGTGAKGLITSSAELNPDHSHLGVESLLPKPTQKINHQYSTLL